MSEFMMIRTNGCPNVTRVISNSLGGLCTCKKNGVYQQCICADVWETKRSFVIIHVSNFAFGIQGKQGVSCQRAMDHGIESSWPHLPWIFAGSLGFSDWEKLCRGVRRRRTPWWCDGWKFRSLHGNVQDISIQCLNKFNKLPKKKIRKFISEPERRQQWRIPEVIECTLWYRYHMWKRNRFWRFLIGVFFLKLFFFFLKEKTNHELSLLCLTEMNGMTEH